MTNVYTIPKAINLERLNPEFIGIGTEYQRHKRDRIQSDRFRDTIRSNYSFTLKLKRQLDKSLEQKQKEIDKLQSTRLRHEQDLLQKMLLQRKREEQLKQRKRRSRQQRQAIRAGLKDAKIALLDDRLSVKYSVKQEKLTKLSQFKTNKEELQNEKCLKHRSVELSKKTGAQRVNEFHRRKNLQSFEEYLKRIKNEDLKSQDNFKKINKMNDQIKKIEKGMNKKQKKLKQAIQQIDLYATEPSKDRKAKFLATISVFRGESAPRSYRSKPSEILAEHLQKQCFESQQI